MADSEKKEASAFTLEEFPGYKCYLFEPNDFATTFTQEFFDRDEVKVRYAHRYKYYAYISECCIVPNSIATIGRYGSGILLSHDVLMIHPNSKIPRSVVSKGTVFSERSSSVPTKVVVPDQYPQSVINNHKHTSSVLLFVNHSARIVFAVQSYTNESAIGGSLGQWKSAFYRSCEIFSDFSEYIEGFTMPYGTKLFTIVEGLSDLDKVLMWGMLPIDNIIHECNIVTGEEEPTVDMLYSVYMMLQSPDDQIVETAFNMLARSKFLSAKYIIRWMVKDDYRARRYRNKSASFKWLYLQCCDNTSSMFVPGSEKALAKELVRKITSNGIDYDTSGTMIVNDSKWLQNDNIRLLASKI